MSLFKEYAVGNIPFIILAAIIVLGPLVVFHEFGHFIVAKLLKIRVDVFSVGFGPRLIGKKFGDTDYRISAIPLGGYVKMKGENLDEELTGDKDEFMSHPKSHRFLVAIAGPAFNVLLAILIPMIAVMIGITVSKVSLEPALVGKVEVGSPAEAAGIKAGDLIVQYGGNNSPKWRDVIDSTLTNTGEPVSVIVERQGQKIPLSMTPKVVDIAGEKQGESGLAPAIPHPPIIGAIVEGMPADRSGLKPGDKILVINGEPIHDFYQAQRVISSSAGKELSLTIERNGKQFDQNVTPVAADEKTGRGVLGFSQEEEKVIQRERNPIKAFNFAISENKRIIVLTWTVFGQAFAGKRNVGDSVAGPIRIAQYSSAVVQSKDWYTILGFMALLSLNLGIFNLFPIPVLDGGLIFMLGMESVLGWFGRTLTLGIKEKMMQVGFVILLLLMGFVIYNDVIHTIPGAR